MPSQHPTGESVAQSADLDLAVVTVSARSAVRIPDGGEQHDRLVTDPAGEETQDGGAGFVQPLHVVGHHHHGTRGCGVAEQGEGGQADEEDPRGGFLGEPERGGQGLALRGRQTVVLGQALAVDQRCEQLVQAGEGQPGLGLQTGRVQHQVAPRLGQ